MEKDSKILVAGCTGLVGSAITKALLKKGYNNIVGTYHSRFTSYDSRVQPYQIDLCNQSEVEKLFDQIKPDYVFLAAAKVGGILANSTYPAEFIYDNIMISTNIIHASYKYGVKKLLNLGSSCIYPKLAPQPLKEEYLLTGPLEPTNEPYAIAKITAIKMCRYFNEQYGTNFISVMPTNLYGPGDNFDLETSHVLPAMLRKIHLAKCLENNDWNSIRKDLNKRPIENVDENSSQEDILKILNKYGIEINHRLSQINTEGKSVANNKKVISVNSPAPYPARAGVPGSKSVVNEKSISANSCNLWTVSLSLWGSGFPRREFLYVDDLADAVVFLMETLHASGLTPYEFINIGTGTDLTIKELAEMIKNIVGFNGEIEWDSSKPDGTPRKLLDVSRISELGWKPETDLKEGIKKTYEWYKKHYDK